MSDNLDPNTVGDRNGDAVTARVQDAATSIVEELAVRLRPALSGLGSPLTAGRGLAFAGAF